LNENNDDIKNTDENNNSEKNSEKISQENSGKSLEERILEDIDNYEGASNTNISSEKSEEAPVPEIIPDNKKTEEKTEQPAQKKTLAAESNYQINLINENLLRIRVATRKGVNIDCSVKDSKSSETQSNRIHLHPKSTNDLQEVEIIISIDPNSGDLIIEKKKDNLGQTVAPVFTPNTDVASLIQPLDLGRPDEPLTPMTDDEMLQVKIGRKNPFHLNRLLYRKNMTIGIVSSVVLASIVIFLFYSIVGKQETKFIEPERRLVVLNDIPAKINFKEYEDPNKPKVEPPSETSTDKTTPPTITRNIIKAPRINRPKINTELDSNLTKDATNELDSLRKLASQDSIKKSDSLNTANNNGNTSDSLNKTLNRTFSENEIGLNYNFPEGWKSIDMRDIDKSQEKFKGIILTDTTTKENGAVNLFIATDNAGKDYNAAEFKNSFAMNDTTYTAYVNEQRTIAGTTTLRFYVFTKTDKLSISAQIKKQYFDQYKPIVESIIRTINIVSPQEPPK